MRTLTRRLQPHARTTWLVFLAAVVVVTGSVVVAVVAAGGDRVEVVMTVFAGFVAAVVLAAFLDAVLAPGNPDVARSRPRGAAGWSGAAAGAGFSGGGGGDCGGGAPSC